MAAVMTLWDMKHTQKAIGLLVIACLLIVELRGIHGYRASQGAQQLNDQKEMRDDFTKV
jgi:hypothetical protein